MSNPNAHSLIYSRLIRSRTCSDEGGTSFSNNLIKECKATARLLMRQLSEVNAGGFLLADISAPTNYAKASSIKCIKAYAQLEVNLAY